MTRASPTLLPQISRLLTTLGENIRTARLRRKFSAEIVSERAGISRPTLRALENGEAGVSIGTLVAVLTGLGLAQDILKIAADDELGRKLADTQLRQRAPRKFKKTKSSLGEGDGKS